MTIKAELLLILAPLIYIPFLINWIRNKTPIEKIVFKSFMFFYLAGVVGFTLFPIELDPELRKTMFANIIMFIPLGCLYPLCSKYSVTWKRMLVTAFILTLAIEMAQLVQNLLYQAIPHSVDVDDLLLNTAGGMIGFAIFCMCRPLFRKWNIYGF
ncbi:VanZ family protein [Listeria newyorkensis]|uniref:VanZ family protein n=1 Tax=Listeria newyorkensis TaxID=1497681 RepID=A0A841YWR7_9LIST|nr:VanZ family protein [Listeria newyorkensis]MBC1457123.1 VanZ family protein [Listeria newyorkensis]